MQKRKDLSGAVAMALAAALMYGLTPAEAANIAAVDGLNAKLDNGVIEIHLHENGTATYLSKNHGPNLVENVIKQKLTFYCDYHPAGQPDLPFLADQLKVITNNENEAEIAYIDSKSPLAVEYHYRMVKGDSGIYSYVVARNNTGKTYPVGEFRTVYRIDMDKLPNAYNAYRQAPMPASSHMRSFKKLQDETYDMDDGFKYTNGSVYSKYDFAGFYKDNPLWGTYGNGKGFWYIPVSMEAYPGGPMKQDLMVHYDGIILNYMTGAHFGTGVFNIPADWKKMYGPWYLYINDGASDEEVIFDARRRAAIEQAKWPYQWVHEEETLYLKQRGSVTGQLQLSNGGIVDRAQVILAKPGADVVHECGSYIFYADTDGQGKFSLDKVRPGTYELTAYMQGGYSGDITTECKKANIVVEPGRTTDLGTVEWEVPARKTIWQLGTADRKASEFRYGGELRNYKWSQMLPDEVDFTIGQSLENKDWYYAQEGMSKYNIHFTMKPEEGKTYHLTTAFAGYSDKGHRSFDILLNGKVLRSCSYENDQTVYRSGTTSGTYHQEDFDIPASLLKDGENVVTFADKDGLIIYDTVVFSEVK
ncbi:MAG: polysaccharide lyase family protein [Selenomonas montiformis]|nr:polysaccharide lyase family protein [Selenomonas montiformis]